ncbi:MAG: hypothetical protein P8R42_09690 [Candidatus Binatia bacterium]|nr:hypothetical protein [Candidatus Binatia bacterium]
MPRPPALRGAIACLVLAGAATAAAHGGPFTAKVDTAVVTKPTTLQTGIGPVHQKVSTESEDAQAFYDQGLSHLHSYRWIEAARSFHEALRLDPKLAMAHVGLARAYEGLKDDGAADAELTKAQGLLPLTNPREQQYVAAYELKRKALAADAGRKESASAAYQTALDALVAADESDAEAWLLRGNASEGPWGRGQGGDETSLPFYEGALRAAPNHFAAHHYMAHTYENIEKSADAVRHAKIYAEANPQVPHARHMYAHTLPRIGRWTEAVAELEAASRIEEQFAKREGLPTSHDWHRVHNLTLLGLAYLHTGRNADAEASLREAFETPIPDPMLQSWHSTWPEFLLLQNRPTEALAAARTLASRRSPMLQVIGLALEGEAKVDQGDLPAANAASIETRRRIAKLQETTSTHPHGEALVWIATEYANVLDSRRALHEKANPEWLAFVSRLGDSIASDPTFDGWGVGWLRLRRLERDARENQREGLTALLQEHLNQLPEPSDAQ